MCPRCEQSDMALRIEEATYQSTESEAEVIGRVVAGEISDERLLALYPMSYWEQLPDEWFEQMLDGPYTFAIPVDDREADPIEDPVTESPDWADPAMPIPEESLDEFVEDNFGDDSERDA